VDRRLSALVTTRDSHARDLLYGHFIPGADRHHVEGLADAIEEALTGLNATPVQPAPAAEQYPTA